MTETKKQIGARIKELRKHAGLTQEALAERIELDARHLSRLEVGRHYPTLDTLEKIAAALNVRLIEFFQFPEQEDLKALRAYLTRFAKQAPESQLRVAIKVIKLVAG